MPFYWVLPPLPVALLVQQAEGNQDRKTSSNFLMHTFNCAESSSIQEYSEEITIHCNNSRMQSLHECDYYRVSVLGNLRVRCQVSQGQWQNL